MLVYLRKEILNVGYIIVNNAIHITIEHEETTFKTHLVFDAIDRYVRRKTRKTRTHIDKTQTTDMIYIWKPHYY